MGADAGAFWGGVLIFLAVWALVQYSEQINHKTFKHRKNLFSIFPVLKIMKKLNQVLIIICITVFYTNAANAFKEGSTFWYKHAPHNELVVHYTKMELDELCAMWKEVGYWKQKRRVPNRNAMKEALINKGEDKFICMRLNNT